VAIFADSLSVRLLLRIEPFAYLRDVFNCMLTHPASELTPRAWKAAHAPR